jgi:hypothetical protein
MESGSEEQPAMTLEQIAGTRILRVTRNEQPFKNLAAMVSVLEEIQHRLESFDRSQHALLVDTRHVQGRMDPAFENAFRHFRSHLTTGFVRIAVLVESAEGIAQARAHAAETGPHMQAFDDENAAMAWLREVAGH